MDASSRRAVLAATLIGCSFGRSLAEEHPPPLRIGLTPVFLDDQVAFIALWRRHLEHRLQRPVQFVQRGSYREIVALLAQGRIEFAWLCGAPYVRHRTALRLLAVPVYKGQPLYRSYLLVPAADTSTRSILDLRGKVFAYSDPDSNSGHLYTQYLLRTLREMPASFFGKTFFAWAHRKVVDAVAVGLAQGGAVDGYVWDTLALLHPDLTARTRIVDRSPQFGFPPFVARSSVGATDFAAMQSVLMTMSADADGAGLLRRLNLDGFVHGTPAMFDSVQTMIRVVGEP